MTPDMLGGRGISAHALAEKLRRALRNGTGATFSNSELRQLGRMGALLMLAEAEARELCGAPTDVGAAKSGNNANSADHLQSDRRGEAREPLTNNAFSPQTLAARWSCSAQKVRSMCRSGELASFTYGKLIRISAAEVARFEGQGISRPEG